MFGESSALPILSRDEVRRVDQVAIEQLGFSGLVLMENAGRGVVEFMQRIGIVGPVVIHCGRGNNAGDGFVIARHLHLRNVPVTCVLWSAPDQLQGDALANFQLLDRSPKRLWQLANSIDLNALHAEADWVLDALLGTGAKGALRSPFDQAVASANAATAKKLAVDIPSGLDCDAGVPFDSAVADGSNQIFQADYTCTFVAAKPGLVATASAAFVGTIQVLDIGVPLSWVKFAG
ncbi:MAG: NAD(P)H-hydrate epimerase [Pirellulaceae bacterium]